MVRRNAADVSATGFRQRERAASYIDSVSLKPTLEIINEMQANGVIGGYMIGGAVGATFYLEPSATEDIDIFVLLPTLPGSFFLELAPVYDYLRARGSKVEGERILVGNWLVQFLRANGPLEREALDQATHTEVEGVATFVPSAEHLVALALRAGRAKDHARIVQFLEQDVVDLGKLNRILKRQGLLPNWEKFERRYLREE